MILRRALCPVFALWLLLTAAANGQGGLDAVPPLAIAAVKQAPPSFAAPVRHGVATLVRDEALLWASPFRSPAKAVRTLIPLAAATGVALAFDRRIASGLPNSADQVRYSKWVSQAGTYYSLAGASAAFAGIGAFTRNRRALETGLIAAQAIAHTESIAQMLKYAGGRERPDYGHDGGGRFWRRQQSFPSGHAMGTWAVATVISKEYHHKRWVRYGIYALPVLVSASRIGAKRHFLSDVIAGGTIGHLMGSWLYNRHHDAALGGAAVRIRRGIASLQPEVRYDHRSRGGIAFGLRLSR